MKVKDIQRYINRYLKKLEGDKKSNHTINNYKSALKDFSEYIENKPQDVEYTTQTFRELAFDYIYSLDSQYAINTINAKRTAMRGIVRYMATEKYIDEDFSRDIVRLKGEKGKAKEVLTTKEIQKIFQVLTEEYKEAEGYKLYYKARNILLFTALLYTGARRSELVGIKWDDVDMINNRVTLHGKNNKTRIIPLKRELKYQLMDYKDILDRLENAKYEVKSDYIFRSDHRNKKTKKKDKPMSPKNVEHIIKSIIEKAEIDKYITPHNLRHNFASHFLKNGGSIPALSGILGHSSPDITMRIYAHEISIKEREREMNKLDFGI